VLEGYTPLNVSQVLKINRPSLYRTPSPVPQKNKKDDPEVLERIRAVRRQFPFLGYQKLRVIIKRQGRVINHKRLYRLMKKEGLLLPRRQNPPFEASGRFELPQVKNRLWQIDSTKVWVEEHGWVHVFAILDVFDRYLVGWSAGLRGRGKDALACLERAVLREFPYGVRGQDLVLMSDRGSCFTGSLFQGALNILGIGRRLCRRRTPRHNAFVESFFAQLKREEVWPNEYKTIEEALAGIGRYAEEYNHLRPHGKIAMLTPAEKRGEILYKIAA